MPPFIDNRFYDDSSDDEDDDFDDLNDDSEDEMEESVIMSNNFPATLFIYYKMFTVDWPKTGIIREKTNALIALFGMSVDETLNQHAALVLNVGATAMSSLNTFLQKARSKAIDFKDFIPNFTGDFYQMTATVLDTDYPTVFKTFALFFVANLWYRMSRLEPLHVALIQVAMLLLTQTNQINPQILAFYRKKGYPLINQETLECSVNKLIGFPSFEVDPCDVIRTSGAVTRKMCPVELTDEYIDSVLMPHYEPIDENDYNIVGTYYAMLHLPLPVYPESDDDTDLSSDDESGA